jgi:hypothetical protein
MLGLLSKAWGMIRYIINVCVAIAGFLFQVAALTTSLLYTIVYNSQDEDD